MTRPPLPKALVSLGSYIQKLPQPQRGSLVVLLFTAAIGLLYLGYSLLFLGQVYPKVMIGDQKFAGLTYEQVHQKVSQLSESLNQQKIVLTHGETANGLLPKEIDWKVDVDGTASKIHSFGRGEDVWQSFVQHLSAPFITHQIEPVVRYDEQALESFIEIVAQSVDQPAVNASGLIDGEKVTFTKEKVGSVVDKLLLKQEVISSLTSFKGATIAVTTVVDSPRVVLLDEATINAQVEELSKQQLVLSYFGTKKTLQPKEIRQMIGFVGASEPIDGRYPLVADFTQDQVKKFLEELAAKVDQPAQEPKLVIRNGVLAIAQASKEGVVINITESTARVLSALDSAEEKPTAELVTGPQQPIINEANLATLGIKERIGLGITDFTGSPTNRRLNIVNGVKLLQSALIKPGAEFSTVNSLGAVDASTGFLPELVIKENRTIPEYGGGLCQVSTTLFRSVLNAGLKVTERRNHSYRVSYYEPPLGLDATIYLPKPDFKFLNDTPGHILVQGRVEGNKVIFELWGTSDGRSSAISDTQILSTTPAGEPIYADTDTLFRGETKQIEKPHDGAVTTVTYTVSRAGAVINKQVFKSIYKAWPARFLVGTKEPTAPPPTP